jgi:hypothetical protein
MKMVSAAKLRGDQQRLAAADPFSVSNLYLIGDIFLTVLIFLTVFSLGQLLSLERKKTWRTFLSLISPPKI